MHQFLTSTEGAESQLKEIGMHQFLANIRPRVSVEGDRNSLVEFYVKGMEGCYTKKGRKRGKEWKEELHPVLSSVTSPFVFFLTESGI